MWRLSHNCGVDELRGTKEVIRDRPDATERGPSGKRTKNTLSPFFPSLFPSHISTSVIHLFLTVSSPILCSTCRPPKPNSPAPSLPSPRRQG